MRRAMRFLIPAACLATFLAPAGAAAQSRRVDAVNAIGIVDYGRPPDFEVGTWVRYHTVSSSASGMSDDYVATVLIAGEERLWGDDGFWLETWTNHASGSQRVVAALLGYTIFQDSLYLDRMQGHLRKIITEMDEQGNPVENLWVRPEATLRSRTAFPVDTNRTIDTLGVDTVHTARGVLDCVKIRFRIVKSLLNDYRDSTYRNILEQERILYMSDRIPITHLAREETRIVATREAWRAGESGRKVTRLLENSSGVTNLVDFGTGGLEPQATPVRYRKPLAQQLGDRSVGPPRSRPGLAAAAPR